MIDLVKHSIGQNSLLIEALKKLNSVPGNLTLFVVGNNGELVGTITDGDIRRGLIDGLPVSGLVRDFMTGSFSFLTENVYDPAEIRNIKGKGIKLLPVLNKSGKILKVIDLTVMSTVLPIEAILMAGGNGERLLPLTAKIPKPMLKIEKKPIIEHNIDHLIKYGIENVTISVRYLGHIIEEFLGDGSRKGIKINYINEDSPLGTIGAVKKMKSLR
jgi:CBS domain-containing protein